MKLKDALRLVRPAVWELLHTRERRAEVQAIAARVDELERIVSAQSQRHEQMWRLLSSRMPAARPYRVVFLVHNVATWSSIASVHAAMVAAADFEPIVVTIPRAFGGIGAHGDEELNHEGLREAGVEHVRFDGVEADEGIRMLERLRPDVIVRQSQWDQDVPPAYAAERLSFARLVLIPYEIANIVHNVPSPTSRDTAVDEPLHREAWRVYCANEDARAQALAGARLGASAWRALGHPKIDAISSTAPHWPIDGPCTGRRVVLSFHHTVAEGWTDFGVFAAAADDVLAWATRADGDQFVLSPHPALEHTMRRTPEGAERWERFVSGWDALPNTALRGPHEPYLPLLASADVVVTDGLSALLEGQLFARPVIWWEREGHAPLNRLGREIVEGLAVVRSADEAERAVARASLDDEGLRLRRDHWVTRFGGGGESAAAAILDDMRGGLA